MRKYEFTGKTDKLGDITLHQIIAVKNFGSIQAGTIGGWIEKEDNLSHDGNCWIYPEACVLENACVFENAKIHGHAIIYGNANIYGNSKVADEACVYDNAEIYHEARICGNVRVHGNAHIYGCATICDNVSVYNNAHVFGNAFVDSDARIFGNARVHGNTRICEHACVCSNANVSDNLHVFWITPVGWQNTPITFFLCADKTVHVAYDIFDSDIDYFEKMIHEKYENDVYTKATLATIEYAKTIFRLN